MVRIAIAFLFLSLTYNTVHADQHQPDLVEIADDRTWQRLLYYDRDAERSDVISIDYFLSPEGRTDPLKELTATLKAYKEPFDDKADQHARCRFPARYLWLSQRLVLDDYRVIPPQCVSLRKSQRKLQLKSISLMYVTGYLGNPASSFGHSFIKLNTRNNFGDSSLFDLSISYGADVPENENVFLYIYRGLFGKYEAKISDKYFYSDDLVFSSTEFRDIWEYQLKLTDQQLLLFQLHMWEILGQRFQYYFLHRNCGYELSRILEVVIDEDLVKSADFYFLPIETFHSLAEISSDKTIMEEVVYHPSGQKIVYENYQRLTDRERRFVKQIMDKDRLDISLLESLEEGQQIAIIDFLLEYHNYLLTREPDNEAFEESKRQLLVKRFGLAPRKAAEIEIDRYASPLASDKPGLLAAKYNDLESGDDFLTLGYSPYSAQSLGQNDMNGNELIVLNTEIGITEDDIFLDRFDFVKIKSYDRFHIPLESKLPLSWQIEAAVENIDYEDHDEHLGYFRGGIGKTWLQSRPVMGYVMFNGGLYSKGDSVLLTPEVGLRIDLGFARGLLKIEKDYNPDGDSSSTETSFSALVPIARDVAFSVEVIDHDEFRASAGLQFYM
ncbi:MAG: DUF4105 domain-containing protein [Gammaproteobacteria bacterium]